MQQNSRLTSTQEHQWFSWKIVQRTYFVDVHVPKIELPFSGIDDEEWNGCHRGIAQFLYDCLFDTSKCSEMAMSNWVYRFEHLPIWICTDLDMYRFDTGNLTKLICSVLVLTRLKQIVK